ncbi:MAG: hypothetical protein SWQ30_12175 [Thermodesulfobacteriota bacterium]|nr:hypothetical protein [Thermodesulfobacteriota bacterium]
MTDNGNDQDERRSGKDRRRFPGSKSIYQWNFDPLGNWWKEKRSGEDRREQYARRQAVS